MLERTPLFYPTHFFCVSDDVTFRKVAITFLSRILITKCNKCRWNNDSWTGNSIQRDNILKYSPVVMKQVSHSAFYEEISENWISHFLWQGRKMLWNFQSPLIFSVSEWRRVCDCKVLCLTLLCYYVVVLWGLFFNSIAYIMFFYFLLWIIFSEWNFIIIQVPLK